MGKVVTVSQFDSVRIEITGAGAVTIPASLILDLDRLLKRCHSRDDSLSVEPVEDEATGAPFWEATIDQGQGGVGAGKTPWAALASLFEEVRGQR